MFIKKKWIEVNLPIFFKKYGLENLMNHNQQGT